MHDEWQVSDRRSLHPVWWPALDPSLSGPTSRKKTAKVSRAAPSTPCEFLKLVTWKQRGGAPSLALLAMHSAREHCGSMVDRYTFYEDAQLELRDGRVLGYAMWGDPGGQPVLLFHGSPASRLFVPDPALTAAVAVRLITVDRPGYGRSDPKPGRDVLDWPPDVEELADTLALPPFPIVAHSSGGPYALACALALPRRVSRIVLASSVAPQTSCQPTWPLSTTRSVSWCNSLTQTP